MTVELRYYTDPACEWSWGSEPKLRRLECEFPDAIRVRPVMGGLERTLDSEGHRRHLVGWLEAAAESGMPCDPRVWVHNPLSSTYPACQAVCAAREQGDDAARGYLRRLREALFCERRRIDHAEALVAEAGVAGLDRDRFEIDLRSHATTESFAADLDEVRAPDDEARAAGHVRELGSGGVRLPFPSAVFVGADGSRHGVYGWQPYEAYREAAISAGAEPSAVSLEPLAAVERLGRCATRELEEICGRPRPVLEAELWAAAREWRLRPVATLTGVLWERV